MFRKSSNKKIPKNYRPQRLLTIPGYYRNHKASFQIDDITWNDLNMDEVYRKINSCDSGIGDEYLYYLLRTPSFDETKLQRMEQLIQNFKDHKEETLYVKELLQHMGSSGDYSIYDYLGLLDELGERKGLRSYLAIAIVAAAIGLLFISFPMGLILLTVGFIWNILSYFKIKAEVDPFIISFGYIFRVLRASEKLIRKKIPYLSEETEILKNGVQKMKAFRRGAFLLMSPSRMSISSNAIEIFLDYVRMILHLDLLQFNRMLKETKKHKQEIDQMLTVFGRIDAVIAISQYRENVKNYCIPIFTEEKKLDITGMVHPLIEDPVANDILTDKNILITGSNASGKSTFLKAVATNVLLAETIHTCLADRFEGSRFRVMTSMSLKDDVLSGASYFMVEIAALKRILDAVEAKDRERVLCFVDEVLRGTNTIERIAASCEILKSLTNDHVMCFAATHDIELTYDLEQEYDNVHFEEKIEEDTILFNYKLQKGRSTSRNAIDLLQLMGYPPDVVQRARERAERKENFYD